MCLAGAGGTVAQGAGVVPVAAEYGAPTDRYPHGALGDEIEYAALVVTLSNGTRLRLDHAPPLVFEDTEPRLVDVDGDKVPEILTVESHETRGARLSIWQLRDGGLALLAATPFIGTRFRWLAPVGATDLDGDGAVEIAYVDRPHLAKTLRVLRVARRAAGGIALVPVAATRGFTNHRLGSRDIEGGIRDCGIGPEIVLATGDWTRIVALLLTDGGSLSARDVGPYRPAALRETLTCR